ncbi:MAG: inositol monophosphatase family protein [Pseudomonadota bacterium]
MSSRIVPGRSAHMNVMMKAVHKAARRLVRDFGEVEQLQVSLKGPDNFVSTADKQAERTIYEELVYARPDYGFIMEESGVIEGKDPEHRWIIDPLDGTRNFLHGIPHFAISVALEKSGEIIAGITYDPVRDEMFSAEKGQGAFLNHRRLRVSNRQHLQEALLVTGLPLRNSSSLDHAVDRIQSLRNHIQGIRYFGSTSLDLAYVAAGRFEAFWRGGSKIWDIATGTILIREAGGRVTEFDKDKSGDDHKTILGSNAVLHDDLVQLMTGTSI